MLPAGAVDPPSFTNSEVAMHFRPRSLAVAPVAILLAILAAAPAQASRVNQS